MSETPESQTAGQTAGQAARRRPWRRGLMTAGPLLVLCGAAYFWVSGGRYMSTEDAYVKANRVNLGAEVAGTVEQVWVAENQPVSAGTPLLELDRRPFQVAVDQAQANLQQTRLQIEALRASHAQKAASLASARSDLAYKQEQYERARKLHTQHFVAQAALDSARHERDQSRDQVEELQQDLAEVLAQLGGNATAPTEQHPQYLSALAALEKARLDLDRSVIRAPIAGIASKVPQPGTYAMPGLPLLSVVAADDAWVEANFKESELGRIRPGQPVTVEVDTYDGHIWHGEVASIGQATGAEFSLLPPQNASGNWVKVVQRIPVRIRLHHEAGEPPLRAGMSTSVSVDTGHNPRAVRLLSALGMSAAAASNP